MWFSDSFTKTDILGHYGLNPCFNGCGSRTYDEGDFMDITVYSECFSKKNLDVLFKHSYYKGCTEIVYSQKYKKLRLTGLEVMKRL